MTSSQGKLTIVDCTLRDGGYYNNWDFKPKLVEAYLRSVGAANVDVVEIGFRSNPQDQFCGPYAYSTDQFLSTLPIPHNIKVCVMADAKDLIKLEQKERGAVRRSFSPRGASTVGVVRVATHFSELKHCQGLMEALKELGYVVGLNLMQATQQPDVAIASAAALVEQWKSVDVLYFADSLGDMLPVDVRQMMSLLRTNWSGPIGIHTHDNRGVALLNSLEAIDQGATWIDSTVLGMGRGAGNTKTEHLLIELVSRQYTQYDAQALFRLVLEDFSELHDKYKWGTNLLYYLAAEYSIHPTYVQQMMSLTPHISPSKIIEGIERLKEIPSLSYDAGQLERAIGGAEVDATGTCSAKDSVAGRDVLLLAGGESVGEHQQGIVDFIGRKDVFVINLNADALVPEELISAFASCHPVRAIAELDRLASLTKPVIVPLGVLPADWAKRLQASNAILDYGLKTGAQGFDFGDSSAALPRAFVALYAMAFANAGGAKRIYLAGFDGYPLGDNRQAEMIELLELYAATKGAAKLVAVTPTSYPVAQSSVYNPGA